MALDDQWADAVAWIMLLASPLFILFGARLFKWVLVITGFLTCSLGVQLLLVRLALWQDLAPTVAALVLSLAGLLGAWALVSLWTAGMFVLGGTAAVLLVNFLHQFIAERAGSGGDLGTAMRWAVLSGVFLVGGFISAKTWKSILRVVTAFVGAYMGAAAIDHLGGPHGFRWWHDDSLCPLHGFFQATHAFTCRSAECYALLATWLALFVVGATFQTKQKHREPQWVADDYEDVDGVLAIRDATDLHGEPCATDVRPAGLTTEQYLRSHARHSHFPAHGSNPPFNHAHGISVQQQRESDPLMARAYGHPPRP